MKGASGAMFRRNIDARSVSDGRISARSGPLGRAVIVDRAQQNAHRSLFAGRAIDRPESAESRVSGCSGGKKRARLPTLRRVKFICTHSASATAAARGRAMSGTREIFIAAVTRPLLLSTPLRLMGHRPVCLSWPEEKKRTVHRFPATGDFHERFGRSSRPVLAQLKNESPANNNSRREEASSGKKEANRIDRDASGRRRAVRAG